MAFVYDHLGFISQRLQVGKPNLREMFLLKLQLGKIVPDYLTKKWKVWIHKTET